MILPYHTRRFIAMDIGGNLLSITPEQRIDVLVHCRDMDISIRDPRYVSSLSDAQLISMISHAVNASLSRELKSVPRQHCIMVQAALGRLFKMVNDRFLLKDCIHYANDRPEATACLDLKSWGAVAATVVDLCLNARMPGFGRLPWLHCSRGPEIAPVSAVTFLGKINQLQSAAGVELTDIEKVVARKDDAEACRQARRAIVDFKQKWDETFGVRLRPFANEYLVSIANRAILSGESATVLGLVEHALDAAPEEVAVQ